MEAGDVTSFLGSPEAFPPTGMRAVYVITPQEIGQELEEYFSEIANAYLNMF